jgi:hypothetical protein
MTLATFNIAFSEARAQWVVERDGALWVVPSLPRPGCDASERARVLAATLDGLYARLHDA